jgi:hypothetical protein
MGGAQARPLATGAISGRAAPAPFAVLMLAAFGLVLTLNGLTIGLSFIGVFLAASYPYLKRYTHLPQVYLGMSFGWGIPMAFAAVQGEVPMLGWLLYAGNILWSTAYDTWYAMVDREDDLKMGSHSTAILFGDLDLVIQGVLYAVPGHHGAGRRARRAGRVLPGRRGRTPRWWCTNSGSAATANAARASRRSCTTTGWVPRCLPARRPGAALTLGRW